MKEIIKDLKIKNQWVFKEYTLNNKIYETKRFNLWFQYFREKETKINLNKICSMYFKTNKDLIKTIREVIK